MNLSHAARRRSLTALVAFVTVQFSGPGLAQQDFPIGVQLTDLLRIRTISEVVVATSGNKVVYVVRSIHPEAMPGGSGGGSEELPKHHNLSNLWLIDLTESGAEPRQLTFGKRRDRSVSLSHDGASVAFVRSGEADGEGADAVQQVWVMPLEGPGEARRVTSFDHGAGSPSWYPDSNSLLVSSSIPYADIVALPYFEHERPGREHAVGLGADDTPGPDPDGNLDQRRAWLSRAEQESNPAVFDRLDFQDEHAIKKGGSASNLYVVDLADSNAVRPLTSGHRSASEALFTPDGSEVFFVSAPLGEKHPDRHTRTLIWRMTARGEDARPLFSDNAATFDSPLLSFNSRYLLYRSTLTRDMMYQQARLRMVDLQTNGTTTIARDWKSATDSPVLTTDGAVLFSSSWEGSTHLLRVSVGRNAEPAELLTDGPVNVRAFDEGGSKIIAAISTPENPCELYLIDSAGERTQLTDLNTDWIEERTIAATEEFWIERPDGARIQCWIMRPTGADAEHRVPVVLEIHGGPMGMWGPSEMTMWHEFQYLCAQGFAVVYANPRGSSGYGYEFQKGNHQDWGATPAGDVLAALDDALAEHDWLDQGNLFVTGGSYGGYLTAWIVGHDQRFDAAVSQRGVYDLITFFGEGNAWRLVEWAFGGFPWESDIRELLARESPFTYVEQIRTPLLIMHGSNDLRTGVTQSEMMYRALKELERPVEYVRYPGAGHNLSRTGNPDQRLDRTARIAEFFQRFLVSEDD